VLHEVRESPRVQKAALALLNICAWAYALAATVHAIT
jgi:hypothetical protein